MYRSEPTVVSGSEPVSKRALSMDRGKPKKISTLQRLSKSLYDRWPKDLQPGKGATPLDRVDRSFKEVSLSGLQEYSMSNTLYGKLFWLSLITVAAMATVFGIFRLVVNYQNCPVSTIYKVTTENSARLPIIQVCMTNSMHKKHFEKSPWLADVAEVIKQPLIDVKAPNSANHRPKRSIEELQTTRHPRNEEVFEVDDELLEWYRLFALENPIDRQANRVKRQLKEHGINEDNFAEMYNLYMNICFSIEDVFLRCYFRRNIDQLIDCRAIVTEVLGPNGGKCFVVDTGDRQQRVPGQGLTLVLDAQVANYPEDIKVATKTEGFTLTIDQEYNPYNFDMIYVQPGLYNRISVAKEHHQYLNVPTGPRAQPCVEKDNLSLKVLNLSYSMTACYMDCFQQAIVKACGCVLVQEPRFVRSDVLAGRHFCASHETKSCVQYQVTELSHKQLDECNSRCHLPCDRWKFTAQTTSQKLHRAGIEFLKNDTENITLDRVTYVTIAFNDFTYTSMSQEWSMQLESFVADLGGQIGLWTGASMITFIHIPVVILALSVAHVQWCVSGLKKAAKVLKNQSNPLDATLNLKK